MSARVRRTSSVAAFLSVLASLCAAGPGLSEDWPHWRGLNRNDITTEDSGWGAGSWPPGSPVWSKNVGNGCTSVIVVGTKLYTMGNSGGTDYVYCLDAGTGAELWKKSYACGEYGRRATGDQGEYKGPSSTPEHDSSTGCLYTLSIDGHLNCWDTNSSGNKKWGFNLYDQFDVPQRPDTGGGTRDYGYTSSPLVHGNWVIVEVGDPSGTPSGNLMAFNKSTGGSGSPVWVSANKDRAGHTGGPVPMTVQSTPCAAVVTLHRLLVVRLDSGNEGKTVGTYAWETDYANNIATPAVSGSNVVLTSNYNLNRTVMLNVTLSGISETWVKTGVYSKVCSPIIATNHVYVACGSLKCFNRSNGNIPWEGGSWGDDASLVLTSDKRLVVFGRGNLALVDSADLAGSYTVKASKSGVLPTRTWPHVVLAGGKLYCKNRYGEIECYQVGSTSPTEPSLSLSPKSLAFNATAGGGAPSSKTVSVTNSGGGTLNTVSTSISYGSGSGWLSVSRSGSGNSQTLTNSIASVPAAGTYTATVNVTCANATNSPQSYSVTLDVAYGTGPGTGILREVWTGVSGTSVTDLTSNANYPYNPSLSETATSFEGPVDSGNDYGARFRGYVIAPGTGTYYFWIASDDSSQLLLNASGQDPAGATQIASVSGYTSSRQWDKYASQKSSGISLTQGSRYYIEALHKEGSGGDNICVRWQLPGGVIEEPIPGHRLDPFVPATNDPPVAVDDSAATTEDTSVTIDVLANDTDPNGDTLSTASATQPSHGFVTVNAGNGTITYAPDDDWHGADSFGYTVSDGKGGTDTATVNVTVSSVNDAPVAVDDAASTSQDISVGIAVLANDSDVDGDSLSVAVASTPSHGTAQVNPDKTITYDPDSGWFGTDSFTYTVSDGKGGSDTATVTVNVTAAGNNPPVAADDAATTDAGASVNVDVLANDSDPDGDALVVQSAGSPSHGSVVIEADDTVTYTPEFAFSGTDTFTYVVGDGNGGTDTATVTVTVNPAGGALPPPWVHADIGAVGASGGASHAGGTFTITGSGADIWGAADEFHFVYQPFVGEGEIVARVATITNTNAWAKAGVMIRETLAADSRHAMMVVTPGNGASFQRRTAAGQASASTTQAGITAPKWAKIARRGDTLLEGSVSDDGSSWTLVGSATVAMSSNVYIGMAVTAHNDGALNTATLDNVSVAAPGLVGHWKFDEQAGSTASDSSPKGNDGTVNGTVTWTTGVIGGALSFDGTTWVSIPNETDYDLANSVSYSVWIQVGSSPVNWYGVVTKYDNMNLQRESGMNHLVWQTVGPTNYQLSGSTNVHDGNWHHVVCTYDGSQKCLYVDGILEASVNASGAVDTTDTQIEIGRNGRWQSLQFKGLMDDVRIYSYALDLSEVQALYEIGTGGGPTADTDGDGTYDSWERMHFGDLSHDGTADGDSDGLSDLQEFQHSTDPNESDTDGDGLSDGWEIQWGFDPADHDENSNGTLDGLDDEDNDGIPNQDDPTPTGGGSDGGDSDPFGCGPGAGAGGLLAAALALFSFAAGARRPRGPHRRGARRRPR